MPEDIKTQQKKILVVLAHPDDESFGMGGTLALYARQGVDVRLICATRGEVGEVDPSFKETIKSAACLRTQELRCAVDALGLSELYFLITVIQDARFGGQSSSPRPGSTTGGAGGRGGGASDP